MPESSNPMKRKEDIKRKAWTKANGLMDGGPGGGFGAFYGPLLAKQSKSHGGGVRAMNNKCMME